MDFRDIIKAMTAGGSDPDAASILSTLAGNGNDMSALLPVLMNAMRKGDKTHGQTDLKTPSLPSDEELIAALEKLNGKNDEN